MPAANSAAAGTKSPADCTGSVPPWSTRCPSGWRLRFPSEGHTYHQRFERGDTVTELTITGDTQESGTLIRFKPDPEIFTETIEYEFETLEAISGNPPFLNAGLSIKLTDMRDKRRNR